MKKNHLLSSNVKWYACFLITIIMTNTIYSQCSNQVTATSGTSAVAGVNITVTSFGNAITNTTYCASTTPYFIGQLVSSGSTANSGYSFQFNPPVDTIMLNFSGISNTPPNQEIIMVEINGSRYSIPAPGNANGCDPMAILTPEGYITGCNNCGVSGWNGTTIAGPVSSITVIDSCALNGPGGNMALFSLFFCSGVTTGIENTGLNNNDFSLFPNPVTDELKITTSKNEQCELILYDLASRKVFQQNFIKTISLNAAQLQKGIYLYEVRNETGWTKKGKVVKQ